MLHDLASAVAAVRLVDISDSTVDKALCHALDSFGAMLAGAQTSEGRRMRAAFRRVAGQPWAAGVSRSPTYLAAVLSTACRLTECDDIHLVSCTTPGSIVFPAVLAADALASAPATAVMEGIVAGYHVMTTLGVAARGPEVVYGHLWPTYLGAAMTAAAAAGKVMGLSEERIRNALAIAATMTTGMSGRIAGDPTSRWLTLGCAVQNGLAAAVGSDSGLRGDEAILQRSSETLGLDPDLARSVAGIGGACRLDRVSLKPFCTSRQGLAATEAFISLMKEESIDPASIDQIEVVVPSQYRSMIDRSRRPTTKLESRGIHYQIALAALYPDELFDIEREHLRTSEPAACRIMDRIQVISSDRLSALYPEKWAGGVNIAVGDTTFEREILTPKGDADRPMNRTDIKKKFDSVSKHLSHPVSVDKLERIVQEREFRSALQLLFENAQCWD